MTGGTEAHPQTRNERMHPIIRRFRKPKDASDSVR